MNKAVRALKLWISLAWMLSTAAAFLTAQPVQVAQAVSGPGAPGYSTSTFGVGITEPFLSGFLAGHEVVLPVNIHNTGSDADHYSVACSKEAGGVSWQASLLDSGGQLLKGDCLVGALDTGEIPGGGSLTLQVRLKAPPMAPSGDYLRVSVRATSVHQPAQSAAVLRQGALSAPFVQNFSDYSRGRQLQVANQKHFFTRTIGPQFEIPNSLVVTHRNNFSYINAWGYGAGKHVNIEYEVMGILSSYPPSVVQLTDNQDYTIDHSTALATAPNGITGAAFIRTIYDQQDPDRQKQNVFFARIDANGLPLGTPVNITNNEQWGNSGAPNVPFFSGVSIRATADNRFLIAWTKQENAAQDIYAVVYNAVSGAQVAAPKKLTLSTIDIGFTSPSLAGLNSSAQTIMTYIVNEPDNPATPISLKGMLLDSSGNKVGADFALGAINASLPDTTQAWDKNQVSADFPLGAINGSMLDTVQLWDGNILVAWIEVIDDFTKLPKYCIWNTSGALIKSPTLLDPPEEFKIMNQIAVTYDQYGRGIITWGNVLYNRMYYALVDGSGALVTPPMIQRHAEGSSPFINLGYSIHSTAFLIDPLAWKTHLPVVSLKKILDRQQYLPMMGR